MAGGVSALIWCGALLIDAHVAQNLARRSLTTNLDTRPAPVAPPPPASGAPLADLAIPRLSLVAVVLQGTDVRTLRRGVGHIEDTAFPGEPGNVALAGHRDTFFRSLRNIRVGDDIFLTTRHAYLHYQVSSLNVVGPDEISVLAPTAESTLTLVTCYPFWVLGHAPDRFVVRATRVTTTE
jgi:sortase A